MSLSAASGLSAFKRTAILMLATWNRKLATALRRTGSCSWTSDQGLFFSSAKRILDFGAKTVLRCEIPCRYPEQGIFRAGSTGRRIAGYSSLVLS
ncbi:hypothetical protein V511_08470 [Mesotoga sp. Brook.08.YT.4.2.5.1]|nr:hypothetical protein V511_08470 [Mesotoga sp. Brook.08.YT.4.2.5.1]RDI90954.1 hypothetical protein Q502_12540 [Mesotoga sp. Brook.08.YT.4.2.5.2.]